MQEGIKWTQIDYFNNKIVCDLIENKVNELLVKSDINNADGKHLSLECETTAKSHTGLKMCLFLVPESLRVNLGVRQTQSNRQMYQEVDQKQFIRKLIPTFQVLSGSSFMFSVCVM